MIDNYPRKIKDLPEEEQEPFRQYLVGKGVPWNPDEPNVELYWPADYRRWKSKCEIWF